MQHERERKKERGKTGESRFGFRARVGIRPKAGKNPGCGAGGRGLRGAGGGAIDAARQDASMSGRNICINNYINRKARRLRRVAAEVSAGQAPVVRLGHSPPLTPVL